MANIAKIFVIIVTYKGHQWYERCFTSLRDSEYPIQTIVIDNASNDGTVEYIREHFPEIHLIESEENLGFGRANNIGMRYALNHGCDYVFLLNQDAWVESNTLSELVRIAEKNQEYGILSPIHLNAERTRINVLIGLGNGYRNERFLSDLYLDSVQDLYETNYVNAAAWLLPRKILEIVGGFDPIFHHYEEDDNYLDRVIFHKFKIGICPSSRIIHDHVDSPLSDERLDYRQKQYLLVEWTNINKQFSLGGEFRYCLRKFLSHVFSRQFLQAKRYYNRYLYCIKMKKAVCNSRIENKQKKSTWL